MNMKGCFENGNRRCGSCRRELADNASVDVCSQRNRCIVWYLLDDWPFKKLIQGAPVIVYKFSSSSTVPWKIYFEEIEPETWKKIEKITQPNELGSISGTLSTQSYVSCILYGCIAQQPVLKVWWAFFFTVASVVRRLLWQWSCRARGKGERTDLVPRLALLQENIRRLSRGEDHLEYGGLGPSPRLRKRHLSTANDKTKWWQNSKRKKNVNFRLIRNLLRRKTEFFVLFFLFFLFFCLWCGGILFFLRGGGVVQMVVVWRAEAVLSNLFFFIELLGFWAL